MAKLIKIGHPVNDAEKWAFNFLKTNLPESYTLLTNLDLYDDRGQPFEVDAVVIAEYAIFLIDIKGYSGELFSGKDVWKHEDKIVENPIPKINQNSRILASRCRKRLKYNQHAPWCQAAIFVTGGTGSNINIKKSEEHIPVYDKNDILDVLTKPDYLTSRFTHSLEKYQKDIALEALCDFKLLEQKNNILGGFKKIRLLDKSNLIETWKVQPSSLTISYDYWMKLIDITALSQDEVEYHKECFKKEYYLLSELSDIPTVPAVLSYIDEGEFIAIVHESIHGTKLYNCKNVDFANLLLKVTESIIKFHKKGIYYRSLNASNIYITDDNNVLFSNIGTSSIDKFDTLVGVKDLNNPWSAPEYIANGEYTASSDSFTLAATFLPYFTNTPPVSDNTIDLLEENYVFVGNDLCASYHGLEEWFIKSISIDPNERKSIEDLEYCFTHASLDEEIESSEVDSNTIIANKYKIIEQIGHGGTSTVWKAKHLIGDYYCCIKILDDAQYSYELAIKEFEILRTSFHPNIIRIFDLDYLPNSERLFLTCQLIDGPTLNCFDNKDKLWVFFEQILSALQYLHNIGIIHKDIKPQNILIENNKAFLIDFNISALDNRWLGTVGYKDPEVMYKGWSSFSDIYSLAVTFLEKSLGYNPINNKSYINTEKTHISLPENISGISSKTRNRLLSVINHDIDWKSVTDYLSWFDLRDNVDIVIPDQIKHDWNIRDGYMVKVLKTMLSDLQPRSRQVIIKNTLKANDLIGNKTNKGSISATISALKKLNIVEEYGTKIRLTADFTDSWNYYKSY